MPTLTAVRSLTWLVLLLTLLPVPARAHPAPFTYVDLRLEPGGATVTLVAHVFDVAHDLQIQDPAQLTNPAFLDGQRERLLRLFADRLTIGGQQLQWTRVDILAERQSVVLSGRAPAIAGAVTLHARLFPYDPAHQTFVNVYEDGSLTLQTILDGSKSDLEYFPGSAPGVLAAFRRFAIEGARHGLAGPEHWLLIVGLLLVGGGTRLIARSLIAFAVADVITTSMIAFNIAHPAARLTDPALALSIVYLGADNLMVKGGRDVRPLIALAFGVLHGFWFGGALALMDLPRTALVWSLVSFDVGSLAVHGLQLFVVWRALDYAQQSPLATRVVTAGSAIVALGGVYLFVQRVFFPAGFF